MTVPLLKIEEQRINPGNPWEDDALDRKTLAVALTNLIKDEVNPLVISLNGGWGTGKTFLLRRWQEDLRKVGCEAIYFNAWEDDYCGDPLVAIIGQLWESLKGTGLRETANSLKEAAGPLLTKTIFNAVNVVSAGVVAIEDKDLKSTAEKIVDGYAGQRAGRTELQKRLNELAKKAREISKKDNGDVNGFPLVFIVDELDRCRPTFAVETLERIKHLFTVPNMVFVLGIDRKQLKSSIKSIYGDIDVDGYLRRFFDMDFSLPQSNPEEFCTQVMNRHNLPAYFQDKSRRINSDLHQNEYQHVLSLMPMLCGRLGLSLRNIEHIIRLFIFSSRNIQDSHYMYPVLLSSLLVLRITDEDLYKEYVNFRCESKIVVEFFEKFFLNPKATKKEEHCLNKIRVIFYLVSQEEERNIIIEQFQNIRNAKTDDDISHLSSELKHLSGGIVGMESEQLHYFAGYFLDALNNIGCPNSSTVIYLYETIELSAHMMDSNK